METPQFNSVGILAFGSLIDNPGDEIKELESHRIECETPFKVEFARISSSRSKAPTLIPVDDDAVGGRVKACVIVLKPGTTLELAESVLWRRECDKVGGSGIYRRPSNASPKNVLVESLENFCGIDKVLYTSFLLQEEYKGLTAERLADFAVKSILSEAGEVGRDGIRYLLAVKNYGIRTALSDEYEIILLKITQSNSLEEAIEKWDIKRRLAAEDLAIKNIQL